MNGFSGFTCITQYTTATKKLGRMFIVTLCQGQIPSWQYDTLHMEAIDCLMSDDVIARGQVYIETHTERDTLAFPETRDMVLIRRSGSDCTYTNVLHVHPLCFSLPGQLRWGHCFGHWFWGSHGTYRWHPGQALSTDQMALHRAPVDHRKVALPQLTLISHLSPTSLWLQSPLTSGTLIELLTLSALHLEGQHEA